MMKLITQKVLILVICVITANTVYSGNYATALIADSLKANADAVIRNFSREYQRISSEKYVFHESCAITILNEKGSFLSELAVNYDNNSAVKSIGMRIYDAKGVLIREIKKRDFRDYVNHGSYTLYSDNRVKSFLPVISTYPFTVEYSFTVEYKGMVGFGAWLPQRGYGVSTEKACLTIKSPAIYGYNYKEVNHSFEFEKTERGTAVEYRWATSGLCAIPAEPSAPDHLDVFPAVLVSPQQISYEGINGDFSSWQNYGTWVYGLLKDRDKLPPKVLDEIRQLTDTVSGQREKTKVLYQYMQRRTRYVNIALGIGGFQPVPASEVHEKGYGDCKALSNYMMALLQGIGIESFYTEIGNGSVRKLKYPEFPSANQTNHVILCVPLGCDTVWLECTSQHLPFGYIGSGNSDRLCLLITGNGGKLARTPAYETTGNQRQGNLTVTIQSNGSADFDLAARYGNYLLEEILHLIPRSPDQQKNELVRLLTTDGLRIQKFSVNDRSVDAVTAMLTVSGNIGNYCNKAGVRLFIEPNFLLPASYPSRINEPRKLPYYQSIGYCYTDTLVMVFPEKYALEHMPDNRTFSSDYGTYQITYEPIGTESLQISRKVTIHSGIFPGSEIPEVNAFLFGMAQSNKERIVLNEVR